MAYLVKTTEVYRLDSESSAKAFIEEQKKNNSYEIVKYSSELRQTKVKGEIADEWYRVTIVKAFNNEKEPASEITVHYGDED